MAVLNHILVGNVLYDIEDANAVPNTRTINNKQLSQNINLTATDVGVVSISNAEIDDIMNS